MLISINAGRGGGFRVDGKKKKFIKQLFKVTWNVYYVYFNDILGSNAVDNAASCCSCGVCRFITPPASFPGKDEAGEAPAVSGLQRRREVFKCSFKALTERRAIGDGSLARESTCATNKPACAGAWKRRGKMEAGIVFLSRGRQRCLGLLSRSARFMSQKSRR